MAKSSKSSKKDNKSAANDEGTVEFDDSVSIYLNSKSYPHFSTIATLLR